jgi:hypothetical protein
MSFGAGNDALFVDVGATATGRITDSDGQPDDLDRRRQARRHQHDTINLTGLLGRPRACSASPSTARS